MRKIEQKLLIGLVEAAVQGVAYAADTRQTDDFAADVLADCFAAFETIERTLRRIVSRDRGMVYWELLSRSEKCLKKLREGLADGDHQIRQEAAERAELCLFELKKALLDEDEIQYVVVFLPYEASMWDSMDTIWGCAARDSRCRVYVSPIPYFERKPDHSLGQMHYDGDLFPEYIDIIDYRILNLESLRPDVIYIHNPYDEYNHVTSIAPEFYSRELKKHTDKLVYVSYFIPGVYQSVESAAVFCQTTGMFYADIIIAQSQVHKQLLAANGNAPDKIAVLGNPKLDYVMKYACSVCSAEQQGGQPSSPNAGGERNEQSAYRINIPDVWKKKLSGRKAVLLCMSIGSFLLWDNMIEMYEAFIDFLINHYESAVLFRPHPLLEATIKSLRPDKYQKYIEFLDKYIENDRFVLDCQTDSIAAVQCSDCMISDYSSLCFSYAVTGKPVAILIHSSLPSDDYYYAFDYRGAYFIQISEYLREGKIPAGYTAFLEEFMSGRDPKRAERMARIKDSVANIDGTSGQKIHEYVMNQIVGKLER